MLASLAKLSINRAAGAHGVLGTRTPVPGWGYQASCSTFLGRTKPASVSRKVHQFAMACEGTVTAPDSPLEVVRVPMFSDNYGWILRDTASGVVAVVDPGEAGPIQRVLKSRSWKLQYILNTHHHQDHVGGNMQLKDQFDCAVYGPAADEKRIPLIDKALADGETFNVGETEFRVFDTPGHTRGHISYWVPRAKALFPGDTLFAMGCGRLFEGTPEQMWKSLSKLKALPEDTQIFCAHEYTENNAKWAVTVDPNNKALEARVSQVKQHRQAGKATVPALLADELKTNPFLRPDNPAIRAVLSVPDSAPNEEAFAAIRWAVTVEPGNSELEARLVAVSAERRAQNATIPTTMALELATNPFLRPDRAAIRAVLNLAQSADDAQVIGALRKHKDAVGGVVAWLVMSLYPVADYFNMA